MIIFTIIAGCIFVGIIVAMVLNYREYKKDDERYQQYYKDLLSSLKDIYIKSEQERINNQGEKTKQQIDKEKYQQALERQKNGEAGGELPNNVVNFKLKKSLITDNKKKF